MRTIQREGTQESVTRPAGPGPAPCLRKLVSGGQAGADRGGLDAAMALGLAHGGWCPRGRRAEDGPIAARYALRETIARDHAVRTEMNVIDSDATLVVSRGALVGGSALTARLASAHQKPFLWLDLDVLDHAQAVARIRAWLGDHRVEVLNVAGPRESQCPGIAADVRSLLVEALAAAGPDESRQSRVPASAALHWFGRHAHPRPLVLLHGFTGAPLSWQPVVDALPASLAAVAMALPGHHPQSPLVPGFEANLDVMAGALASAGLRGCHLVGYSLGARAALGLALRHPGLAATLTLIGGHPGLEDPGERRQRVESDRAWIELLRQRGLAAFLAAWEAQPLFVTQAQASPDARARQQRIRACHEPEALAQSLEQMGLGAMPGYGPRLAELDIPVTWIVGALDPKFLGLAGAAIQRARADRPARLVVVPGSGHNVPLERPHELAALLSAQTSG
jgi:2-succinyl-6-hydroxy-2,4-cyclohexadiene-1-carboxylate synthase